jgi:hypothetical protein
LFGKRRGGEEMEQAPVAQGLEEAQAQEPEEAQVEVPVGEQVEEEGQEWVPAGTAYVLHVVHEYRTSREHHVHP